AAKLDAVTLYNLVNGICVKKFVAEREYEDGIHACLFLDDNCHALFVLWKDKGRKDVSLPPLRCMNAQTIGIDGRGSDLECSHNGLTVTVNEDPLLLTCDGLVEKVLPEKMDEPYLKLITLPSSMVRGVPASIEIATKADPKQISLIVPPGWKVERQPEQP